MTKQYQKLYARSGIGSGVVYVLPKKNWRYESPETPVVLREDVPPKPDPRRKVR